MVVIIVTGLGVDAAGGVRCRVGVGDEEMGVNLAGMVVVAMIGTGVDMLKRREQEGQQKCQARLDGCRAMHY
jgi:hypothetical protein